MVDLRLNSEKIRNVRILEQFRDHGSKTALKNEILNFFAHAIL